MQSREIAKAVQQFQIDVSKTIPEMNVQVQPSLGLATITDPTLKTVPGVRKAELLKTI